jgi:hypothetical protein
MRKKLAAVTLAAAAAVPVAAPPAHAAETHVCSIFVPPYDEPCKTVIRIYCMLTRDNPLCR